MNGLVIKNTGSWYIVRTGDGRDVECKVKGNFRLKGIRSTNPVAVGDRVQIAENREGTAFITEIEDRKNYIIRRASNLSKQSHILAANLDQCMLIVTVNYPETSTTFIDRFLATAEAYRVPVLLLFNKTDLYDEDDRRYLEGLVHLYTTIGYPCLKVSAIQGQGMEEVKAKLRGRMGGYIIDTPGIKGFGTFDMETEEIGHYFPEIFKASAECRYSNCTHRHEPGCAVLQAVEEHRISQSRYASYLSMLDDKEESKYREAY